MSQRREDVSGMCRELVHWLLGGPGGRAAALTEPLAEVSDRRRRERESRRLRGWRGGDVGGGLAWGWDPALSAWVAEGGGGQYRLSLSACDLDSVLYRSERWVGGRVIYLGEFTDPAEAAAAAAACAERASYSGAA